MFMMERNHFYFLLSVLLAMVLYACGNAPRETDTANTAVSKEPKYSDTSTLPATSAFLKPETTAQTNTPLETPVETETEISTCELTAPDMLGPFYEPGAPIRNSVGEGYILTGVVRSVEGCRPIPGATIEFWLAGPDGEYADEYRATVEADENGAYRFESNPPPPYSGRPPHIHIRVTAPGYQELVTQHYPQPGQTEANLDLVIQP